MSVITAPWLQPANVLQAMSSGASLGLQRRSADQRDAEMALRERLAEEENARQTQSAAERLLHNRDALSQARELALRDDAARSEQHQFLREQSAAELLRHRASDDALAQYRAANVKNDADKIAFDKLKAASGGGPKFHKSGHDIYYGSSPDDFRLVVKQEHVPIVEALVDPKKPTGTKMRLRLDDPLLNRPGALPADLAAVAGTNFQSRLKIPASELLSAPVMPMAPMKKRNPAPSISEDLTREEPAVEPKVLDVEGARAFLKQAGGDRAKAERMAREAGYTF